MDISSRLEIIITHFEGGNATNFAKRLGIPQSTVHNYTKKGREPHSLFLKLIHEKLGVNINWVLTGEGEMFIKGQEGVDAPLDSSLLKSAIEYVESILPTIGVEVDSDKKAELIKQAYIKFMGRSAGQQPPAQPPTQSKKEVYEEPFEQEELKKNNGTHG